MSNMGYCRFQNTLADLEDCEEALDRGAELSEDEKLAKVRLLKLCRELAEVYLGDED